VWIFAGLSPFYDFIGEREGHKEVEQLGPMMVTLTDFMQPAARDS
jgi:hypothetical protein